MALNLDQNKKRDDILDQKPGIQIFLQPIAPPAALGLAGFAGSTWITSSYIANWWGNAESPTIFFPFVGIFGGLAQFIAGLYGFKARDTLVTVIVSYPVIKINSRETLTSFRIQCGAHSGSPLVSSTLS